jgi:hypothetical protein
MLSGDAAAGGTVMEKNMKKSGANSECCREAVLSALYATDARDRGLQHDGQSVRRASMLIRQETL